MEIFPIKYLWTKSKALNEYYLKHHSQSLAFIKAYQEEALKS